MLCTITGLAEKIAAETRLDFEIAGGRGRIEGVDTRGGRRC